MRRIAADVGAALGLVLVVVGAPWALASWGKAGDLARIDWAHAFSVRDDGRLLLGVLSLLGWVAWLVLVVSIVVETAEVVDRLRAQRAHRPHRPLATPGLDLPRLLVRGLVVSVVTAAVGLTLPRPQAPPATPTVTVTAAAGQVAPQAFTEPVRSTPSLSAPAISVPARTRREAAADVEAARRPAVRRPAFPREPVLRRRVPVAAHRGRER